MTPGVCVCVLRAEPDELQETASHLIVWQVALPPTSTVTQSLHLQQQQQKQQQQQLPLRRPASASAILAGSSDAQQATS